jgi:hypothetical protein
MDKSIRLSGLLAAASLAATGCQGKVEGTACGTGQLCNGAFGGKNTRVQRGTFLKVTGGSLPQQTGGSGNRPFNDFWLALLPIFGVNGSVLSGASGALTSTGALPGVFS